MRDIVWHKNFKDVLVRLIFILAGSGSAQILDRFHTIFMSMISLCPHRRKETMRNFSLNYLVSVHLIPLDNLICFSVLK